LIFIVTAISKLT